MGNADRTSGVPAARLLAIALLTFVPVRVYGICSPSGLDTVRSELRATRAPRCAPKPLRRAFNRARNRAARLTRRAVIACARAEVPRLTVAHDALASVLDRMSAADVAGKVSDDCATTYETLIAKLDADLTAAETGVETTTTTVLPGTPTTTTLAPCTTVSLEIDKGDCTSVTSDPPGVIKCGANCNDMTFTVRASRPLRLKGTPAPGDVGVTFGTDCDDDGTVPLGDATPPDCSLSCDCSSGSF